MPGYPPYKRSDCQLYPGQGPRFSIEQLNGFQDYNELVSALITSETPPQIKKNKTANLEQSDQDFLQNLITVPEDAADHFRML